MKYKAIYSVLEKRGREVPGFRYDDRSCWRLARLTYYRQAAQSLDYCG